MHRSANSTERDAGVLRLAVPDPPTKPLDLLDDEVLRRHSARCIVHQTSRRQLRVLESHRDVVPIEDRRIRHAGIRQNRAEAIATIRERSNVCGRGSNLGYKRRLVDCGWTIDGTPIS